MATDPQRDEGYCTIHKVKRTETVDCGACGGEGWIENSEWDRPRYENCWQCGGTGIAPWLECWMCLDEDHYDYYG